MLAQSALEPGAKPRTGSYTFGNFLPRPRLHPKYALANKSMISTRLEKSSFRTTKGEAKGVEIG